MILRHVALVLALVACGDDDTDAADATADIEFDVSDAADADVDADADAASLDLSALEAVGAPITADDLVVVHSGGLVMPCGVTVVDDALLALGVDVEVGHIVAYRTTDGASFEPIEVPAEILAFDCSIDSPVDGRVFFTGRIDGRTGVWQLQARSLDDDPRAVELGSLPYWLQATRTGDDRVLLGFADPDREAADGHLALGDRGGGTFMDLTSPIPSALRGLLVHVGSQRDGALAITWQEADPSFRFASFLAISPDHTSWSEPIPIAPEFDDVHDAFLLARGERDLDVYYLRQADAFSVFRRPYESAFGAETRVTDATVGHVEKPQPRRLPDGTIALLFAIRRSTTSYDLALARLND